MRADPTVGTSERRKLWVVGVILTLLVLFFAIAVGPVTPGVHHPVSAWSVQNVHLIGQAMCSYAQDHNGAYPTGKSSTEVFQKLIDDGYVSDPGIFFRSAYRPEGKVAAPSMKLKPENVCWDVTTPLDSRSPDDLPVVFSTGYRIAYAPNGTATPLPGTQTVGLAVFYHSKAADFKAQYPQGVALGVIPPDFKSDGKKSVQLTPDGPLP